MKVFSCSVLMILSAMIVGCVRHNAESVAPENRAETQHYGSVRILDASLDEQAWEVGRKLRATEEGGNAYEIAGLSSYASYQDYFAKRLGLKLGAKEAPATAAMLKTAFDRLVPEFMKEKDLYSRMRPWTEHTDDRTCRNDPSKGTADKSFPSGHTARGWLTAILLGQLMPECSRNILEIGYEIGTARWICGHHWLSDVDAGRLMATRVSIELNADEGFKHLMKKARRELAAILR